MIPNWTHHLKDPEDIKRFTQHINNSRSVLERLSVIMKDKEKSLDLGEINQSSYDSPSWAAKQAHRNGYRECLAELNKLITLDPKDKTNG